MIEDTSKRDHFTQAIGLTGGSDAYITGMEASGQRQLVASTGMMPAEGDWDALKALGFGDPEPTSDRLFVKTILPEGWTKGASEHDMYSNVVDERGVERVSVFYKAAFYDCRSSFHITNVGYSLSTQVIYGDDEPALPEKWDVLDDTERTQFVKGLKGYQEDARRSPKIYADRLPRVDAVLALLGVELEGES